MRIPGTKWLHQQARWLRSRWTGGVLILGYHRISITNDDPYGMCVSKTHFNQQLAVLSEVANPISLEQLLNVGDWRSLPPKSVIITFDDGYVDNLQNAYPLLSKYNIPATLFVTTGFLGKLFWWDELAQLILESPELPNELSLRIGERTYRWVVHNNDFSHQNSEREEILHHVYSLLLSLKPTYRREVLNYLQGLSSQNFKMDNRSSLRAMDSGEIRQISKDGLVKIGAHTVTHPRLADLPNSAQLVEIEQSKKCLEEILDKPVKLFSYPNGSFNNDTCYLLQQAGIAAACASHNDVARPGIDLLHLPRFWVPNWQRAIFSSWLRRWLPS